MIKPRMKCILHGHHPVMVGESGEDSLVVECLRCHWPLPTPTCLVCGHTKTNIPEVDLRVHAKCMPYAVYPASHLKVLQRRS